MIQKTFPVFIHYKLISFWIYDKTKDIKLYKNCLSETLSKKVYENMLKVVDDSFENSLNIQYFMWRMMRCMFHALLIRVYN